MLLTMDQLKGSKLQSLLTAWPSGTVSDTRWLRKQGYRFDLVDRYRRRGWLVSMGRGVVARKGDHVDWTGGLYAVQTQLHLPIHVGGKTSLRLQGVVQYLPMGTGERVTLFGPPKVQLPGWFTHHDWGVRPHFTSTNMWESGEVAFSLTTISRGAYEIQASVPERAIMELLHAVPHEESFEEADQLMESLPALRPDFVTRLLVACRSIKVKRVFLFLAERHQHSWVKALLLAKVNLGKGERTVVKGGRWDAKYQITVPKVEGG